MDHAHPLPDYLAENYRRWKSETFQQDEALHQKLVSEGQKPKAMVISCCDSRVNITSILGTSPGDLFVHRNIANFVPPNEGRDGANCTPAAIEYAVTALNVSHIIVVGHSECGGVAGCHAACTGNAPELADGSTFVGRWITFLRPAFDRLDKRHPDGFTPNQLEQEAVTLSLENLMTYPFVRDGVDAKQLTLHGLWTGIEDGALMQLARDKKSFVPV